MKKEYVTPRIACVKIASQNLLQQSSQQTEMKISTESFNSNDFEDL